MKPDDDSMEPHLIEKRPSWWLLYVIAAVMVALVALVETSVADEGVRVTLEMVVVVTVFAIMLRWLRANRGWIELAEAAESRQTSVNTPPANKGAVTQQPGLGVARLR